jgi:hypothetical protein
MSCLKIAYLSWGSLLWDYSTLPIKNWQISSLQLPLEFSRISDNGNGRLTLVIDPHGTHNNVWYALSTEHNIDKSIHALKIREKTTISNIAYINRYIKKRRITNTPKSIAHNIEKWAESMDIDVVIWTDLKSNWPGKFSNQNAFQYYLSKHFDLQLKIVEYIFKSSQIGKIQTSFSSYFFNNLLYGSIAK